MSQVTNDLDLRNSRLVFYKNDVERIDKVMVTTSRFPSWGIEPS